MTRLHLIYTRLFKVDIIPVLEMKKLRLIEGKFLIQGQILKHHKGWNWLRGKRHRRSYESAALWPHTQQYFLWLAKSLCLFFQAC